jgi:hypothetical protein
LLALDTRAQFRGDGSIRDTLRFACGCISIGLCLCDCISGIGLGLRNGGVNRSADIFACCHRIPR